MDAAVDLQKNSFNFLKTLYNSLIIATLYTAAGLLSMQFSPQEQLVLILWLPAGVAAMAVLQVGLSALPGVFLGSFAINVYIAYLTSGNTDISYTIPILVGAGATLQALFFRYLIKKFDQLNSGAHELLRLLLLAGPASCVVNALFSSVALLIFADLPTSDFFINAAKWWFGDSVGAVIALTWGLALCSNCQRVHNLELNRRILLVASLTAVLLVTVTLNFLVLKEQRKNFAIKAKANLYEFQHELEDYLNAADSVLYSIRGFVLSHDQLNPEKFNLIASQILLSNPQLAGVSWNASITGSELAGFESALNSQFPNLQFEVKQRNADGDLIRAIPADRHVVVTYIEPLESNLKALGYDVYSQQNRKIALDTAFSSGKSTATAPIKLVQSNESQSGALIFLPVFSKSRELLGYATVVIKVGSIVDSILDKSDFNIASVQLSDTTNGELTTLYSKGINQDRSSPFYDSITHTETINFAGRDWKIQIKEMQEGLNYTIFILISASFLLAAGLSSVLLIESNHQSAIKAEVIKQTGILQTLNKSLRDEKDKQNKMFAIIGHELRTPVATMKMMLEDNSGPDKEGELKSVTQHLLHLLDDLRLVNHDKHYNLVLTSHQLSVITHNILNSLQTYCRTHNFKLNLSLGQNTDNWLLIPAKEYRQVLTNLVKNAVIHSAGNQVNVELNYLPESSTVNLAVSDNGKGIPEAIRDKIFDEFERGDSSADGSGIGLSVCRTIARSSGGDIIYQDNEESGSTFVFTMVAEEAENEALIPPVESNFHINGLKVLIAEDNATLRLLTCKMLEKVGAEVITANDGKAALDLFNSQKFDLVITDIMMPVMTGYELTSEIRATGSDVSIIGVTAAFVGDECDQLLAAGANAVISKPIDIKKLKETLETLNTARV